MSNPAADDTSLRWGVMRFRGRVRVCARPLRLYTWREELCGYSRRSASTQRLLIQLRLYLDEGSSKDDWAGTASRPYVEAEGSSRGEHV